MKNEKRIVLLKAYRLLIAGSRLLTAQGSQLKDYSPKLIAFDSGNAALWQGRYESHLLCPPDKKSFHEALHSILDNIERQLSKEDWYAF